MGATKRAMDFVNVKDGGSFRPRHVEEGEYVGKIISVEDHESKAGDAMWLFGFKRDGDERSLYPIYVGCDDKQAWKVRKMLIAAGIPVPAKRVMVDPNRLLNKTIGVYMEDDEFEGKMRSKPTDFMPPGDIQGEIDDTPEDDEDEVYERPAPKAAKKKAAPVVEEEDDEEYEDDEEEAPPVKPAKKAAPAKAARRRAEPEPEEDDDVEEDDEPEPPRRTAKKAAPAKKAAARRRPADDDDDLDLDEI